MENEKVTMIESNLSLNEKIELRKWAYQILTSRIHGMPDGYKSYENYINERAQKLYEWILTGDISISLSSKFQQ